MRTAPERSPANPEGVSKRVRISASTAARARAISRFVTGCSRTGGKRGWQLYSISRWSAEDGARLRGHLELEFEARGNRQIYWDDVAMFCHFDEYRLGIRPMGESDCLEIDSLEELKAADPSYR